jgi:hypothetical protein
MGSSQKGADLRLFQAVPFFHYSEHYVLIKHKNKAEVELRTKKAVTLRPNC